MSRGVALALSGGTARGWAHIGAISLLREAGVPIGAVAGTSMGAIAAVCLAADRLDVLDALARGTTRLGMARYLDPRMASGALLGGRTIARELGRHFGDARLERLPIPTGIVAADLTTGRAVTIAHGPIVPAVRASIALPGLFEPVEIDGRLLIDGGVVTNLPLEAARAIAPGLPVVAIDVMGDYAGAVAALTVAANGKANARPRRGMASVARLAFLMSIARQAELQLALDPPAVSIRPTLGHLSTGAFHRAEEMIAIGRAAAAAALPAIEAALTD